MDKDNKKPEEDKKEEPIIIDNPEDIKKVLEELGEDNPDLQKIIDDLDGNKNISRVKIVKVNNTVKSKILSIVSLLLFNVILGISFTGIIRWTNSSILEMLIFLVMYTMIWLLLKYLVITFLPKIQFITLGLVSVVYPCISFIVSIVILGVKVNSVLLTILFFIVINLIQFIIKYIYYRKKLWGDITNGKKGNNIWCRWNAIRHI